MKFNVEVCLSHGNIEDDSLERLRQSVLDLLCQRKRSIQENTEIKFSFNSTLSSKVSSIRICECTCFDTVDEYEFQLYFYQLNTFDDEFNEVENSLALQEYELPHTSFDGIWDSLIIEKPIMTQLLQYYYLSQKITNSNIDMNLVSWNHILLFYGPPGTGKSSVSKAFAQKIAIRNQDKHSGAGSRLFEINACALFSKYFSESSKQVIKLFKYVSDYAERYPECQVVVLFDEIESLVRDRALNEDDSSEPGDSLRVVNAVLTQIDRLRGYTNILMICTSNLTTSIDKAFMDRADLKISIGLPDKNAIYKIMLSSVVELQRTGIIAKDDKIMPMQTISNQSIITKTPELEASLDLYDIAEELEKDNFNTEKLYQWSGRWLKKLPFLALTYSVSEVVFPVSLKAFVKMIKKAIASEKNTTNCH